ncbi:RNA polymerase sigma factor [Hufsiella ginkgonis]|uniref:Sigma-70 family RNA polymerase sigma factor n=1 Tax=Hufsiella ginkgonis TaxID=2695274 RepID=A0A7K1XX59_9SPHI|nr:RNA polymerase sigma factor [Hufsiella ginkgonis]MXV15585.1 sigma-70 family RNA polymerase sigma factor [Hufsiella ginkgonis]
MAITPGISEAELIRKCKKGDLKSQELLYKQFYGYAMGVGLRYLDDRDDVLEIVNDAFIKVFKSISTFNEDLSFKAWFRKVLVNTALDRRRKNGRQVAITDIEDAAHVGSQHTHIEVMSARDILNLLSILPEAQRTIFNLFEIDGYSHEEIGNMLGIPASSSRVYLGRAKDKLKKAIINQHMYNGSI